MADKFDAGFMRDGSGRLALAEPGAKEAWVSGFVRDDEGRLVVVGPEGQAIGGGKLSVKAFGAKGDGTTNDTAAFIAAIAAASSQNRARVYIPDGEYVLSEQLSVTHNYTTVEGESELGAVLSFTSGLGAVPAVKFTGAGTNGKVEMLTIKATSTCAAGVGFNAAGGETNQLRVEGAVRGVRGEGSQAVKCRFTTGVKCTETAIKLIASASRAIWCNAIECGSASASNEGGIMAEGGTGMVIDHCTAEGNATHGIYATKASEIEVTNCRSVLNGLKAKEATRSGRGISVGKETIGAKISGNTCKENYECGIYHGESGVGIENARIAENYCLNNNKGEFPGGHGIEYDGIGGSVTGNYCSGNNNGISLNGSKVTVSGNSCIANKKGGEAVKGHGIQFNESDRHTITGNLCTGNAGKGILGSSGVVKAAVVVTGNQSYSNTEANIEVSAKYEGKVVANNVEA